MKLNSIIKVALKLDDLSEETHIEKKLKKALIARGNIHPSALSEIEKNLYNKLELSNDEKKYDSLLARISTSRPAFWNNLDSSKVRELYALTNNPETKERFEYNNKLRKKLIKRNARNTKKENFNIPSILERKAYKKLKLTPNEKNEKFHWYDNFKNAPAEELLYAKYVLNHPKEASEDKNDHFYLKALIGRGNKNPKTLSNIEKKLYNKLELSDKQKKKRHLLSRWFTRSPYLNDVNFKTLRDNYAYYKLDKLNNKK